LCGGGLRSLCGGYLCGMNCCGFGSSNGSGFGCGNLGGG
jgi:hypothetical protein